MARKKDKKNAPRRDYAPDVAAMPKTHPVKNADQDSKHKMHVPADLRALGITSMKNFVLG